MLDENPTEPPPPPEEGDRTAARRRTVLGVLTLIALFAAIIAVVAITQTGDDEPTAAADVVDLDDPDFTLPSLATPSDAGTPSDGEAAPNFSIVLVDDTTFDLAAHQRDDGRPVFLNFWASWCIPCRNEMPAIDASARAHSDVLFIGIAVDDDPTAAARFAEEIGVEYPIGIDESETVSAAYPTFGLPASFLISAEGVIVRQVFGEVTEEQIDELVAEYF